MAARGRTGELLIPMYISLLVKSVHQKVFFLFLNQTYVVGTQKNCLDETVLLSTQNLC